MGKGDRRHTYGAVVLDDCNFHESARLDTFDQDRTLSIVAPEGEVSAASHTLSPYPLPSLPHLTLPPPPPLHSLPTQFTLMNYRVTGEFLNNIPFRVYTTVEDGDLPK